MNTPIDEFVIKERPSADGRFVIEDDEFNDLFHVNFIPPDPGKRMVMVDPEEMIKQIGLLMIQSHKEGAHAGAAELKREFHRLMGIMR